MKLTKLLLFFSIIALACSSCENGDADEADHNLGDNCLMCHKVGGGGEGVFSVGGTVYSSATDQGAAGVTVELYSSADRKGSPVASMTTAMSGNFYQKDALSFGSGLYATVKTKTGSIAMTDPVLTGACSSCHGKTTDKITVQ